MPLDINQLAPVALWLTVYSDVASNPKVSLPAWLAEERPEAVKFAAVTAAQYAALVDELRAAREALAFYADPRSYESVVSYRPYRNGATLETVFGPSPVGTDEGKKARTALAGKGGGRG